MYKHLKTNPLKSVGHIATIEVNHIQVANIDKGDIAVMKIESDLENICVYGEHFCALDYLEIGGIYA
jgi:hypothetical protein